eukprot:7815338-Lingulodinium_polyedra.AAC.1
MVARCGGPRGPWAGSAATSPGLGGTCNPSASKRLRSRSTRPWGGRRWPSGFRCGGSSISELTSEMSS